MMEDTPVITSVAVTSSDTVSASKINFKEGVELSDKQNLLNKLIKKNKIVLATGPAGSSKTFTACYTALQLLNDRFCSRIILCKPTEIVGNSGLGYLKGGLDEKLEPYLESFVSNFAEIVDKKLVDKMIDEKTIEFVPVQFIRGRTYNYSVVIIDEFQSFDIKELMAIVTRFGRNNCKMIFIGDINQSDINKRLVAVDVFDNILHNIDGVGKFKFEKSDIVRDPIIIEITDRYEKMKELKQLTPTKGDT